MTPRRLLPNKYVHRTLTLIFLLTVTMTVSAQWAPQQDEGGIPAYNAGPPPKDAKLPALLTKADLWGADAQYPYQTHAYELASRIPTVIHQQPCYCYCDRMGHNSLHSCFENTHGARCSTCRIRDTSSGGEYSSECQGFVRHRQDGRLGCNYNRRAG